MERTRVGVRSGCGARSCAALTPTFARAEVQATISDVLAAVTKTFNVKSRMAIPLEPAASASYSGSFEQVISRLLDGYNYVIKTEQGTTEIIVLGEHGAFPIAPPPLSSRRRARGIP